MAKLLVFFLVCLAHSLFLFGAKRGNCDYIFGDAAWSDSKIFFDKQIKFPAGAKTHTVILPGSVPQKEKAEPLEDHFVVRLSDPLSRERVEAKKGLMISYVCITLPPGIDRDDAKINYHPLDREVSVALAKPATKEFKYHLFAKRHGY